MTGSRSGHGGATPRQRLQDAVTAISTAAPDGRRVHDVLWLVASHARAVTDADAGIVVLPDAAGGPGVAAAAGDFVGLLPALRTPRAAAIIGAAFTARIPLSSPEGEPAEPVAPGNACGGALAVPFGHGATADGVLLSLRAPGAAAFADDDLDLLCTLADLACLALVHAVGAPERAGIVG